MVSSLHSRSRHQIDRTGWDAVLGDQLVGTTKGITFRLVVEERPAHDFDLTLRQVNTPDEFRWRGEMWGVLAGTHFRFQTFHADPARTHLIHAESYTGIMAWFMGYSMASSTASS